MKDQFSVKTTGEQVLCNSHLETKADLVGELVPKRVCSACSRCSGLGIETSRPDKSV